MRKLDKRRPNAADIEVQDRIDVLVLFAVMPVALAMFFTIVTGG